MGQLQVLWLARIITEFGTFRIWLLILCPDVPGKKGQAASARWKGLKITPIGCCKVVSPKSPKGQSHSVQSRLEWCAPSNLEVSDLERQPWLSSCVNLVGSGASPFKCLHL